MIMKSYDPYEGFLFGPLLLFSGVDDDLLPIGDVWKWQIFVAKAAAAD